MPAPKKLPKTAPELPPHTPAETERHIESIKRWGILSAIVKTEEGKTIQGRLNERTAALLKIPKDKIPTIVVRCSDAEADYLRIILELSGRDRSKLGSLLKEAFLAFPHMTSRDIAKIPGMPDRRTVDRHKAKLIESGDIQAVPMKDRRGYTHQPPAVLCNGRTADRIGKKLATAGDEVKGGMMSRRALNTAVNIAERKKYAKDAPQTLPSDFDIRNCDYRVLAPTARMIDLVTADPPWSQWTDEQRVEYARAVYDSLRPGGWLLAYTGNHLMLRWGAVYEGVGFTHRWGLTNVFMRPKIRNFGDVQIQSSPILLMQKGGKFVSPNIFLDTYDMTDTVKCTIDEPRYHDWQQHSQPLTYWISKLTRPGARILDYTLCTGTTAVAVARAGQGRSFLGSEIDPTLCAVARRRVAEELTKS